jgi:hypothetical protein
MYDTDCIRKAASAHTHTTAKYFIFPLRYDSRSMKAKTAEVKSPGAKRLCLLLLSVLSREIIEYEMIDVEKCTTM